MIIAHFFLRKSKGKHSIYLETTSSSGIEQPSPVAQYLVDVDMGERRMEWVRKSYYAFHKKYPHLVLIDAMENMLRLESDHPSFDLVFVPEYGNGGNNGKDGKDVNGNEPDAIKHSTSVIKNLFT